MSRFTIKTRDHGDQSFFMPDNGGHVFLEIGANHGSLGRQICRGGRFLGDTVRSTPDGFENACRAWHKARMAVIRELDLDYQK